MLVIVQFVTSFPLHSCLPLLVIRFISHDSVTAIAAVVTSMTLSCFDGMCGRGNISFALVGASSVTQEKLEGQCRLLWQGMMQGPALPPSHQTTSFSPSLASFSSRHLSLQRCNHCKARESQDFKLCELELPSQNQRNTNTLSQWRPLTHLHCRVFLLLELSVPL